MKQFEVNRKKMIRQKNEEIEINGTVYVPKSTVQQRVKQPSRKGMEYCIVRTYSAGVFAGWIKRAPISKEKTIFDSRRIWYWDGAASLSQLANDGTKSPANCKFGQVVAQTDLTEVIEVIPATITAKASIEGVAVWEK